MFKWEGRRGGGTPARLSSSDQPHVVLAQRFMVLPMNWQPLCSNWCCFGAGEQDKRGLSGQLVTHFSKQLRGKRDNMYSRQF